MPQNQRPDADLIPPTLSLSARPFMGTVAGGGAPPGPNWGREQPRQGVTILAVEDSRFACEALRLIARRAGARLRRAETMAAARDHLRVYRPDVVLIDLGLPDGRGDALIRDLAQGPRRPPVVMGTSGGVEGRALALAAGADGFLDKPLENIAQLCRVLRPLLPELDIHPPPIAPGEPVAPDPLALHDDLAFAQRALQGRPNADQRRYVSAFVAGIARHSQDAALAATALDAAEEVGLAPLRAAIAARLAQRADFPTPP
jgi:CheY-like chemotaxis protein